MATGLRLPYRRPTRLIVRRVFTDSFVGSIRPAAGQKGWTEMADWACRGLHLKLSSRGEKVWAIRHMVGGRRRRHIIGAYPTVSLSEARRRAGQYLAGTRDGRTATETDARELGMTMTVAQAHSAYITDAAQSLKDSTIELKKGMFRTHLEHSIGTRLVRTIRKSDVVEVVTRIRRHSPVQANRVFAEMMAMLRWCEEAGFIDGIPSIRKRTIATKEKPRRRTLADSEIADVWRTAGEIGEQTRDFIRLLLLTGQRRDEVRRMAWEEINMPAALWVIPASRYKTGIDHVVPLSATVMEILRARWTEDAAGFVLSHARRKTPFNGAAAAMRRLRPKLANMGHFTLHDMRRTVRTGLARLGVDDQAAEMILGHALQGMQKVYDLHDRLQERRNALDLWASHVIDLVDRTSISVGSQAA